MKTKRLERKELSGGLKYSGEVVSSIDRVRYSAQVCRHFLQVNRVTLNNPVTRGIMTRCESGMSSRPRIAVHFPVKTPEYSHHRYQRSGVS